MSRKGADQRRVTGVAGGHKHEPKRYGPARLGAPRPDWREGGAAGRPVHHARRGVVVVPVDLKDQSGRMFSACGPFWPWVTSNSTRWFSSRLR
ncbi:hypothetical protein GA0070213_11327 [Micromonospora humi]|uniref:Uncharacterized protein n=1 Tax=Micromonospora humi TaxID=745366 RepID=A0A1C5JR81_9ACTN|nr:hypothetical protein GA0070213_11327 [Micromonospora humi]